MKDRDYYDGLTPLQSMLLALAELILTIFLFPIIKGAMMTLGGVIVLKWIGAI